MLKQIQSSEDVLPTVMCKVMAFGTWVQQTCLLQAWETCDLRDPLLRLQGKSLKWRICHWRFLSPTYGVLQQFKTIRHAYLSQWVREGPCAEEQLVKQLGCKDGESSVESWKVAQWWCHFFFQLTSPFLCMLDRMKMGIASCRVRRMSVCCQTQTAQRMWNANSCLRNRDLEKGIV